jgi:hypothetical protein
MTVKVLKEAIRSSGTDINYGLFEYNQVGQGLVSWDPVVELLAFRWL